MTINNHAGRRIEYYFRWGKGDWRRRTVEPGNRRGHSHKYKFVDEHKSPPFEVTLDRKLGPGSALTVYRLAPTLSY